MLYFKQYRANYYYIPVVLDYICFSLRPIISNYVIELTAALASLIVLIESSFPRHLIQD